MLVFVMSGMLYWIWTAVWMGDYHLEVWMAVRTPTRQGSCDKENWILEGQGRCGAVWTSSKKQQRDPESELCAGGGYVAVIASAYGGVEEGAREKIQKIQ